LIVRAFVGDSTMISGRLAAFFGDLARAGDGGRGVGSVVKTP
jgi:hypothetical protein